MALFPWNKKKFPALPQPKSDWPWILTVGGYSGSSSDPGWQEIEEELQELIQDSDSYLILEQKNPRNPKEYWFIQCAVAIVGPDQGNYAVEVGFSSPEGSQLWERMVPGSREAAAYFSAAYHHKFVDFSGFEKMEL